MIELQKVSKWVKLGGRKHFILDDIEMVVDRGEFISIMGPSGAGKSTLLHIIGLMDLPDEGRYSFLNHDVFKMKEKQRAELLKHNIGFVFQAYHLIDELTVYENIETPLTYLGLKAQQRKEKVDQMLARFHLSQKKDLFPPQLSGGQQQLVGIARAMIAGPKLLLADEPTGNLSSKQAEEIMILFTQLNREGITIIQATHSEKNAAYGSRIINLLDGRIDKTNSL